MNAIFKRELKSYFLSPIAYVLIGIFFVFTSLFFYTYCVSQSIASMSPIMGYAQLILLIVFPILTMKIFADEYKNNTEVLLLTSPVSITKMVIAKYLAAFMIFLIMVALTFLYVVLFYVYGAPNTQVMVGSYVAFILFGAAFLAVDLFIASLTEIQVVAAVSGFFVNILFYFMSWMKYVFGDVSNAIVTAISPIERTADYWKGMFSINNLVFFVVVIVVFLFFTIRKIEKKRWS